MSLFPRKVWVNVLYCGNVWQGGSLANLANRFKFAKLKPSKLFHLKLARAYIGSCHSPCNELYEVRFKFGIIAAVYSYSYANFHMLVSTQPLLAPLTPVPIDQRISCQNPSHRFLNMLYKAHHIVTRSAKTRHNSAFLEIDIFASVCFMYLKLCSVLISSQYCK